MIAFDNSYEDLWGNDIPLRAYTKTSSSNDKFIWHFSSGFRPEECGRTPYIDNDDDKEGTPFALGPYLNPIECVRVQYDEFLVSISVKPFNGEYSDWKGNPSRLADEFCVDVENGEYVTFVEGMEHYDFYLGMKFLTLGTNTGRVHTFSADQYYQYGG